MLFIVQFWKRLSFVLIYVLQKKSLTSIVNEFVWREFCNCIMWRKCVVNSTIKLINSKEIKLINKIFWKFTSIATMIWSETSFRVNLISMIFNRIKHLFNSFINVFVRSSMFWSLLLKRFVEKVRTTSYIIQNWFDSSLCFKRRFEISKTRKTKTFVEWIFDD